MVWFMLEFDPFEPAEELEWIERFLIIFGEASIAISGFYIELIFEMPSVCDLAFFFYSYLLFSLKKFYEQGRFS